MKLPSVYKDHEHQRAKQMSAHVYVLWVVDGGGKFYVGKTKDMNKRRQSHMSEARNLHPKSRRVQKYVNQFLHRPSDIRLTSLESIPMSPGYEQVLAEREKFWIRTVAKNHDLLNHSGWLPMDRCPD
jgi:GIY-YIG catalytic domain